MQNLSLAYDYVSRAKKRLIALKVLFEQQAWADVVREAQEIVELSLKGLLRHYHIEVPRIHDTSAILINEKNKLPNEIHNDIKKLAHVSKTMRRDRELAFYGSEDLTPSEFYNKDDAKKAFTDATWVVATITPFVISKKSSDRS